MGDKGTGRGQKSQKVVTSFIDGPLLWFFFQSAYIENWLVGQRNWIIIIKKIINWVGKFIFDLFCSVFFYSTNLYGQLCMMISFFINWNFITQLKCQCGLDIWKTVQFREDIANVLQFGKKNTFFYMFYSW